MPPKTAVTPEKLEALGAKRLAELLFELGNENSGIKRRLRLELSAEARAEGIAADISKRLGPLRKARSFIDWQKRPAFVPQGVGLALLVAGIALVGHRSVA